MSQFDSHSRDGDATFDANSTADGGRRPRAAALPRHSHFARTTSVLCWLYAASLLALWVLLLLAADRWWPGTVAMYSPRWLYALPSFALLPAALLCRRRSAVVPLALGLLILLGPVMHLCIPWRRGLPFRRPQADTLRVVTLNADLGDLKPDALRRWIEETRPDVVAIQALASGHRQRIFGLDPDTNGWYLQRDGELLLASRYPIAAARVYDDARFSGGDGGTLAAYDLQTPSGVVHLFNLHTASPRYALLAVARRKRTAGDAVTANIQRRHGQSEMAREWVDAAARSGGRVLVVGDFNMPPDSAIYRRFWSSFSNAFSVAGFGFGSTHFTRHTAVRIDHVLAGPGWRFRRAWTGPFVGSAHRPVCADVAATADAAG
jgi:vancomycin resistance protein VanJ